MNKSGLDITAHESDQSSQFTEAWKLISYICIMPTASEITTQKKKPSSHCSRISKLMSSNTFGMKINPRNFLKEAAANKSTAEAVFIPSNSRDTNYSLCVCVCVCVKYPPEA